MNYEKEYKEAFKRAERRFDPNPADGYAGYANGIIEDIFPQFIKREDERIRKALIKGLNFLTTSERIFMFGDIPIEDIVAYLEKQKEQSWMPTEGEMGVLYKLCYLSNQISDDDDTELTRLYQDLKREYFNGHSFENMFPKQKEPHYTKRNALFDKCVENCDSEVMNKVSDEIDEMLQKEQKPTEIDEYKIIKKHITEDSLSSEVNKRLKECGWYVTDEKSAEWSEEDKHNLNSVINLVHSTTVGAWGSCIGDRIENWLKSLPERFDLSIKQDWSEENEKDIAHIIRVLDDCYAYGKHDLSKTDHENLVNTLKSIHPQLKSEWSDEDEGELQNAIDALEFLGKKGVYESESGYDTALKAASWLKSLPERFALQPKPEWSEKDEKMLSRCVKSIKSSKQFASSSVYEKDKEINWLKALSLSFKKRNEDVAKLCSNEWSEEDEKMFEDFMHKLEICDLLTNKEIAWAKHRLKSLRPQPKLEWSEEDKRKLDGIIQWLREYQKEFNPKYDSQSIESIDSLIDWLKSLYPSWKPSEEQMRALWAVWIGGDTPVMMALGSLLEDLKKL